MRTDKKVIRLRKQQPLLTGSEIARKLNISRQYVSRILQHAGLNNKQPHYRKRVTTCLFCGKITFRQQKFCPNSDCREQYYYIDVTCSLCHYNFKILKSTVKKGYGRGSRYIYCSSTCYSKGKKQGT